MTKEELEQRFDMYLSVYGIADAGEQERVLRQCVADEIVSVLPGEESRGIAELLQHTQQFQQKRPSGHFGYKILSVHHSQFLATLTLHGTEEQVLATAHTYGRFNEEGLLTYLISFFF